MRRISLVLILGIIVVMFSGCMSGAGSQCLLFDTTFQEAEWIRDGQPIEFEGELWYPQRGVETFLDYEVYKLGQYKKVDFFVDKVDVRPYNRLYTRFGKNKFRFFEKKKHD
ncbi:MAG: hypothetical protein HQL26_08580 [Candidatus Omnitrophica bacterium]|nr:hypothetical protein [Candidatus Omnitrophota bacterium]